ncbi:MAG: hypothetical protein HQK78_06140 [Desulfobacterales bacterium]|nr:hypothetical protein [Desulfobacterales bacterium]
MKELFTDILKINDIDGVLILSFEGKSIYSEFTSTKYQSIINENWVNFVNALEKIREAEVVFQDRRIYIKRAGVGFLIIVMGKTAPLAMVRLNCDILLPELEQSKKKSWFGKIFKR